MLEALQGIEFTAFYFQWPWVLLLLGLIPLYLMLYRQYQAQKWKNALRFSYTSVVEHLRRSPSPWRRLLLPLTVCLLIFLTVLGLARPTVEGRIPQHAANMMLVMDISLSMMAEDIRPDRITAARQAAIRFIKSLPRDSRIGLELFAGNNYVVSPPTQDHREIIRYMETLEREHLQPRTEIGSALHTALSVLQRTQEEARDEQKQDLPAPQAETAVGQPPQQVIILLSDGDSHEGYPWPRAARDAIADNVTIHTVGIGSPGEATIVYQGQVFPVTFNESTLRQIAEMTEGQYFRAFKESDFQTIYSQIREKTLSFEEQTIDLGFVLCGLSLLFLLLALAASVRWVR